MHLEPWMAWTSLAIAAGVLLARCAVALFRPAAWGDKAIDSERRALRAAQRHYAERLKEG